MKISVFGLGKVGLTLSACLSSAGNEVIGVDLDGDLVEALTRGSFHTCEPGLLDRLAQAGPEHFAATTDAARAIRESDLSFVIVPTPSNVLGGFSLRYVLAVCGQIGASLKTKNSDHTVAVVSTMLPGSSELRVIPCLEKASGRKVGDGLGYAYNPSFIALGEIVAGIEHPDYLLIGDTGTCSGDLILSAHRTIMRNTAPVVRMSPVEAEITKIASNTHETMRVSFANMLLSVCSEVPGANVDRITEALAHRMGRRFFKGAVPYGGPCWPRDNKALAAFMEAIHTPSRLPRAVDLFNDDHGQYVLRKILSVAKVGETVGILGLAYKPGTSAIDRSFGVDLAMWLVKEGRPVIGWDPLAISETCNLIGDRIGYASSPLDCLERSDVVVIVNPLREVKEIDWPAFAGTTVIDCWRCLPPANAAQLRHYIPLGHGPDRDFGAWAGQTVGEYFDFLTD
jgi:UDPglucose 6-dehydrogenase